MSVAKGINVSTAVMRFIPKRWNAVTYLQASAETRHVCACESLTYVLVIMLMTHLPITGNDTTGRSQSASIPGCQTDITDTLLSSDEHPWREELALWVVSNALKCEVRTQANNAHFIFTVWREQNNFPLLSLCKLHSLWKNIFIYLSVCKRWWAAGLFYVFVYICVHKVL